MMTFVTVGFISCLMETNDASGILFSGVRESMGMNQNIILYHDTDPNQTMALRACIVSGMQTRSGASGEIVSAGASCR